MSPKSRVRNRRLEYYENQDKEFCNLERSHSLNLELDITHDDLLCDLQQECNISLAFENKSHTQDFYIEKASYHQMDICQNDTPLAKLFNFDKDFETPKYFMKRKIKNNYDVKLVQGGYFVDESMDNIENENKIDGEEK